MNTKLMVLTVLLVAQSVAPSAMAQSNLTRPAEKQTVHATASANPNADATPVEKLERAAQELRDAIHEMLSARPDANRTAIIEAADKALAKVESAIANLPPDLLTAEADEIAYKRTMDHLQQANQSMNEAIMALRAHAKSILRDESIKSIHSAISQTHQLTRKLPRGASGA